MYKKLFKLLQITKSNKYLNLVAVLILLVFFTSQKVYYNSKYKELLIGNWFYKQDSLDVVLEFNKSDGYVNYISYGKRYDFKYKFINDSIIKIWSKNEKTVLHVIRKLDNTHLQIRPYPIKNREAIDMIDQIDFIKNN